MLRIYRVPVLLLSLLLVFGASLLASCDLEEETRDTALRQSALEDENAAQQLLSASYNAMVTPMQRHNWFNNLQGVSSVEQVVPFRGGTDWFDGGRFIEMHEHSWTTSHVTVVDVWSNLTQGVGRATRVEKFVNERSGSPTLALEARGLQALYSYWLLDMWNVAFDKAPEDAGTQNLSTVFRGSEAVGFIRGELDQLQQELPGVSEIGRTRFNKSAAKALEARLLLNKAVYEDRQAEPPTHSPEDLNTIIDLTTELIENPQFSLERDNYFNLFARSFESNPEIIFEMDKRVEAGGSDANGGDRHAYFHASRNRHANVTDVSKTGSDGGALTQDFFDMWMAFYGEGAGQMTPQEAQEAVERIAEEDPRIFHRNIPDSGSVAPEEFRWNKGIQIGQQFGIWPNEGGSSVYLEDEEGNLIIRPLVDEARTGDSMVYTRSVGTTTDRGHLAGPRSLKWSIDHNPDRVGHESAINMPILRLGEMYFTRAEAHARLGDYQAAREDINEVRRARGARELEPDELNSLEDLEREWLFEFYQEHKSRTIQIRFNNFTNGTWRDKPETNIIRRLFPIPENVIDRAEGEEGFLEQNPGY
jgi:hypothetical protein